MRGLHSARRLLVDGKRINSRLSLAVMQEGAAIQTTKSLGTEEKLSPRQQAFIDHDIFQCGYCTPGQIDSAQALSTKARPKPKPKCGS